MIYIANKTIVDNIEFASAIESKHYEYLRDHPNIEIIKLQPKFLLLDRFRYYDFEKGKDRMYGAMTYKADFLIVVKGIDKPIVFETKGYYQTLQKDYPLRKKLWYSQYGENYYFVEVTSMKQCKEIFDRYR